MTLRKVTLLTVNNVSPQLACRKCGSLIDFAEELPETQHGDRISYTHKCGGKQLVLVTKLKTPQNNRTTCPCPLCHKDRQIYGLTVNPRKGELSVNYKPCRCGY